MKKLVFASTNLGKLKEIKALMPDDIELLSPLDIGFTQEIEETGKTFEENAELKARAIFEFSGLPAFADDSGLEVAILKNAPGVKSARYAGEPSNSSKNNELLLKNMKGLSNRKARFVCVICLVTSTKTLFFEGLVNGEIAQEASGENGFGYDPVFIPESFTKTFGELGPEIKNQISHRNQAFSKMLPFLDYI